MTDTELPTPEIDLLTNTVEEALSLAHEGFWYRGYLELHYGLERAKAAQPEPWAPQLIQRWRYALAEYARCWLPMN